MSSSLDDRVTQSRRTSAAPLRADVVVNGGGVTGLFLAHLLSEYNLRVLLIEKQERLAAGASIRNEGWLHASFHAAAIGDHEEAVAVARRTCFGHRVIREFAPEALEDIESRSFALIPNHMVTAVRDRWEEAGVGHRLVPPSAVKDPINRALLATRQVLEVPDVSIDTRVLYTKLALSALRLGARILVGHEIVDFKDHETAVVLGRHGCTSRRIFVRAPLFLHAMGPDIKPFFRGVLGIDVPLGFSVSHLLDVTPRVAQHAYYMVERHAPTVMHHEHGSIVGLAKEQTLVQVPSTATIPAKVRILLTSARALLPEISSHHHVPRACVKVFCTREKQRGLLPSFEEPITGHAWVIPGKMTEAPYVAAQVLRRLCWDRFALGRRIQQRPLDDLALRTPRARRRIVA